MNTALKITAFATALTAVFGAAYGVGSGIDPLSKEAGAVSHPRHSADPPAEGAGADMAGAGSGAGPVDGLQVSDDGYTLDLRTPRIRVGEESELRFAVLDGSGRPVTAYRREHGKDLHLILAARDLTTFRHVHPTLAGDGTWSTRVELPEAGDYRVFADFTPDAERAEGLTLGGALAVSGEYEPSELPEPSRTATVDDYTVTLDGDLKAGTESEVRLNVAKDGKPVTDLEPYLEAYGHLVALRAGDLAYLHVHPNGAPGDGTTAAGPDVSFGTTVPSAGFYRLFLDFKHRGEVRTAAFTVEVAAAGR